MRPRPRTWPSIRLRRLSVEDLASLRINAIYPRRVFGASGLSRMNSSSRQGTGDRAVHTHTDHAHHVAAATETVTDPVCGMKVDPHLTHHQAPYQGQSYFFCSAGCYKKFIADPKKYAQGGAKPQQPASPGTIYTCPMHPQIRQVGPGACPICGMALEPEVVSAETGP